MDGVVKHTGTRCMLVTCSTTQNTELYDHQPLIPSTAATLKTNRNKVREVQELIRQESAEILTAYTRSTQWTLCMLA